MQAAATGGCSARAGIQLPLGAAHQNRRRDEAFTKGSGLTPVRGHGVVLSPTGRDRRHLGRRGCRCRELGRATTMASYASTSTGVRTWAPQVAPCPATSRQSCSTWWSYAAWRCSTTSSRRRQTHIHQCGHGARADQPELAFEFALVMSGGTCNKGNSRSK